MRKNQLVLHAIRQGAFVFVLAASVGLQVNALRPAGMPLVADWSPEARLTSESGDSMVISLETARDLCSAGQAVFLDARPCESYELGHIACARNLPWRSFDEYVDRVIGDIPKEALIVGFINHTQTPE